jgi:hypothetical protein
MKAYIENREVVFNRLTVSKADKSKKRRK